MWWVRASLTADDTRNIGHNESFAVCIQLIYSAECALILNTWCASQIETVDRLRFLCIWWTITTTKEINRVRKSDKIEKQPQILIRSTNEHYMGMPHIRNDQILWIKFNEKSGNISNPTLIASQFIRPSIWWVDASFSLDRISNAQKT